VGYLFWLRDLAAFFFGLGDGYKQDKIQLRFQKYTAQQMSLS